MRVNLVELIGEDCLSLDEGEKLYQALYPEIKKGNPVELDFTGVKSIITPFLNACFGKLLEGFEKETLMEKINFCHISTEQLKKVNQFIDGADRRGTDTTLREMMTDMFEEDELGESGL
ncbi:MAG: STAS-like domain-containing protein [Nitrospinaceae bacterium]